MVCDILDREKPRNLWTQVKMCPSRSPVWWTQVSGSHLWQGEQNSHHSSFSFFPLNILKSEPFKPHLCSKLLKSNRTIYRGKKKTPPKSLYVSFCLFQREKIQRFMISHRGSTWNFVLGTTEINHKSKVKWEMNSLIVLNSSLNIFFQKREAFQFSHYQAGACTTLVLQPLFF